MPKVFLDQSPHRWPGPRSAAYLPPNTEANQATACDVEGDLSTARLFRLHHPFRFVDQLYACTGMGWINKVMVGGHGRSYTRDVDRLDHWLLR